MSLTRAERRLLDRPDGIFRLFWKRLYRELRLRARAEAAQWEHDVMWGRGPEQPKGILSVTSRPMAAR